MNLRLPRRATRRLCGAALAASLSLGLSQGAAAADTYTQTQYPVALALLWAAWSWLQNDRVPPPAAAPVFTDWSFSPFAEGNPLDAVQHNAEAVREAAAARARVAKVLEHGSLRGSELDGDWGQWVDGQLQPSLSLRRRFGYMLTALGEVQAADLAHWIDQEVSAERNAPAARQVLAVWGRYIRLQQTSFTTQVNPVDAATWQAALAERTAARQQILGVDWAKAFYADEERTFVAFSEKPAAQRASGADEQTLAIALLRPAAEQNEQRHAQRVAQFGAEAAERLQQEDASWADWEQRLQAARERMQAIAAAPELSALQRRQAQDAALAEAFSGNELVRARSLLGAAP